MEVASLMLNIKGKKHVERSPFDQCIKSLMPPTPAPPLISLKLVGLESRVSSSKLPLLDILKISLSGVQSSQ